LVVRRGWLEPERAPAELLIFDPREWATVETTTMAIAFRRWQLARHDWAEAHPDGDLGDLIDCLREEIRLKREYWDSLSEPA
jgi:hypothetical protein